MACRLSAAVKAYRLEPKRRSIRSKATKPIPNYRSEVVSHQGAALALGMKDTHLVELRQSTTLVVALGAA